MSAGDLLAVVYEGQQRNGVVVFGLYQAGPIPEPAFPAYVWPSVDGFTRFRLFGEAWQVVEWDLAIDHPPIGDQWHGAVRRTLQAHVDAGAVVAWIGSEGDFCDPPGLFDPDCMGGVFAVLYRDGEFDCRVWPGGPSERLGDVEMFALRERTGGLAESA